MTPPYADNLCRWGKEDTLRFKGLGILMIVLHNFFHLVCDLPRENEFYFLPQRAVAFWQMLQDTPTDSIRIVSSFVGHFGVQIFMFLSAYGLTRKFLTQTPGWGGFMVSRYRKIYPVFALAVGLWLAKILLFSGRAAALSRLLSYDLLYVVLNIANLIRGQAGRPVGPWWFLSFIFQFYAVFPLLFWFGQKTRGKGLLGLAVSGVVVTALFNSAIAKAYGINLYYTFVAHLPELCLGIYLAQRQQAIAFPGAIIAAAAVVFVLGCIYPAWWSLNHISALVLLIALDGLLRKIPITALHKTLLFYGAISLPLFLVNAYLRDPWLGFAKEETRITLVLLYALVFLLVTTTAAFGVHVCNLFLRQPHKVFQAIRRKYPAANTTGSGRP